MLKKGYFYSLFVLLVIVFSCKTDSGGVSGEFDVENYPDILDIKNVPQQAEDWSAFCFSDLGNWQGYALPPDSLPEFWGSFPGPFLMTHGRWLSKSLLQPKIFDKSKNAAVDFKKCLKKEINYYPGRLVQKYEFEDVLLEMSLIFVSKKTALIKTVLKNISNAEKKYQLSWDSQLLLPEAKISNGNLGLNIQLPGNDKQILITTDAICKIEVSVNTFKINYLKEIILPVDGKYRLMTAQTIFLNKKNLVDETDFISDVFQDAENHFSQNRERWNRYLGSILAGKNDWRKEKPYQNVAVKALETLITNWRSANGHLYHGGLFPSYAVWYFNGFWAWDSWKHAVALAEFEPELAKNQIRSMFDYQNKEGMIADCIYADSTENNWLNTKPPLAAWAVWKIFEKENDLEFLKEMYPQLKKYHYWWYQYRDHDQNGLCEYGATQNKLVGAKWESGMDNAIRFDAAKMVKNDENAYSIDQESVDLNAYLYAEKKYLEKIADEIKEEKNAVEFYNDAEKLQNKIRKMMFDTKSGYFYDIKLKNKKYIPIQGPEGWTPLWAGVADKNQAEAVKNVMNDTLKFSTFIPFPTVAKDCPQFSRGYWRGPVWFDQACFAVQALQNYGYKKEAEFFTKQLFDRPEGLLNSTAPIRENYWPIDGTGMRVNHFSWSAAHLLMLYCNRK